MPEKNIYMFGGQLADETTTNALWKLQKTSLNQFTWTEVSFEDNASQPSPRHNPCCWQYKNKFWTFGGDGSTPDGYIQHSYKFH
jgi:hypothetical protein